MKDYLMWVYHYEDQPKVINSSELEAHLENGWKESPAELAGTYDRWKEALGAEEGEEIPQGELNAIGNAVADVCEITNFMLNVDKERSKKKIIKFLDERNTKDTPIHIPAEASLKELRKICHEVFD